MSKKYTCDACEKPLNLDKDPHYVFSFHATVSDNTVDVDEDGEAFLDEDACDYAFDEDYHACRNAECLKAAVAKSMDAEILQYVAREAKAHDKTIADAAKERAKDAKARDDEDDEDDDEDDDEAANG